MSFPKSIGFIGIGTMGLPMATNLLRKCHDSQVYVYDVAEKAIQALVGVDPARATACASPQAVANSADVILSMVPAGTHARDIYLNPDSGVVTAKIEGKLLIDCSTIDVASFHQIRKTLGQYHPTARFLDAPVSGGSLGAEAGTLTFMVGCSDSDAAWVDLRDLLNCMGTSIFACGGPSLGLTAKFSNNYCSGLIAIATAEAMNLGMKSGMSPRVLAEIFATSTAQSRICDKWNPVPGICPDAPSTHDYQGGFRVELMKKDFGLAIDAAEKVGARLCLGKAGLQTYTDAAEDPRCVGRDSRVVFRHIGGNEAWEKDL